MPGKANLCCVNAMERNRFSLMLPLQQHLSFHSPAEPFICQECREIFNSSRYREHVAFSAFSQVTVLVLSPVLSHGGRETVPRNI